MNISQAKQINLVTYLEDNGHIGTQKGEYFWFSTPLREEKTPSFSVDVQKNTWMDWGTNQSGDIIDLVKLLFNTDTSGALEKLSVLRYEKLTVNPVFEVNTKKRELGIKLERLNTVQYVPLLDYLSFRKIPLSLSMIYLKEAHYTVKERKYHSIAFANDYGGYELRNLRFKNCISPKYITTFPIQGSKELNLFEGFFSFLSALDYYKIDSFPESTIILNSVNNIHHVNQLLPGYKKVISFLDNDMAGRKVLDHVRYLNPRTENRSMIIHPKRKDFNDYMMNLYYINGL